MQNPNGPPESKTLWVGDIENWMDEDYLINMFAKTGAQVLQAKIIMDKNTNMPLGYGFVEFTSHEMAAKVLQLLNQSINPATNKPFKLNWGNQRGANQMMGGNQGGYQNNRYNKYNNMGGGNPRWNNNNNQQQEGNPLQLYVGDLDLTINETFLLEHFKKRYMTASGAKIIVHPATQMSKGYGFVSFTSPEEVQKAIQEMNGTLLNGKTIKCSQTFVKAGQNGPGGYQKNYNNNNMGGGYNQGGYGGNQGGFGGGMGNMGGQNGYMGGGGYGGGFPNQMGMQQNQYY